MSKRHLLLLLTSLTVVTLSAVAQLGCAPLAAGVAGAAVGHEIAEEEDEDDGDRD